MTFPESALKRDVQNSDPPSEGYIIPVFDGAVYVIIAVVHLCVCFTYGMVVKLLFAGHYRIPYLCIKASLTVVSMSRR